MVEVRLGGVDGDDGHVARLQRLPARADELLEVHVADVARVVVAGDHDELRALDALEVLLGQQVVLAEAHLGEVAGAEHEVGLELVELDDHAVHQARHEVRRAGVQVRDVGDRQPGHGPPDRQRRSWWSSLHHNDTPGTLLVEDRERRLAALAAEAQAHRRAPDGRLASVTSPSHLGRPGLCTYTTFSSACA